MSTGTYRAVVCPTLSANAEDGIASLRVVSQPRASLAEDEVRIAVKAAALNFFDLLMLQGKYQVKPPTPFVVCSEGSGVVAEAGAQSGFAVGDRVSFNMWAGGAAAEEAVVSAKQCSRLPASLSFEQGAGFHVGYVTAYHGLVQRGRLQRGETVLITGAAGGMGVAALQIAKLLGATVIAAASDDKKLAVLRTLGADHVVNIRTENLRDRVMEITQGRGAEVIYESVGGAVFDQCVRCISIQGKGRLLVIGFASGTIPKLSVNMALIKGFDLVGVRAGAQLMAEPQLAAELHAQVSRWAAEGRLVPHVHCVVPLERAQDAFRTLLDRSVIGKAVISTAPAAARL